MTEEGASSVILVNTGSYIPVDHNTGVVPPLFSYQNLDLRYP
jgi:hypothetical protein